MGSIVCTKVNNNEDSEVFKDKKLRRRLTVSKLQEEQDGENETEKEKLDISRPKKQYKAK
jgi:hypothetical protein